MSNQARRQGVMFGVLLLLAAVTASNHTFPPPCDSDIYCQGSMLHVVQMARLHKDSKHFVDMSMRFDPEDVHANFDRMMAKTENRPTREDVRKFVDENFLEPSSEFVAWNPSDWKDNPAFLSRVQDRRLRAWVRDLHRTWKQLGREVTGEVYLHPDRYSLIFVPNPTIVPGGRFREYYYWDSYWVIKGLLLSEMHTTVRGMLENFLVMVRKFGFVPNGGRVYYARRSQPPFLIPMTKLYTDATGDLDFLRMNLPILEREYDFWRTQRTIEVTKDGKKYTMYRYSADVGEPRPESYREDYELAESAQGVEGTDHGTAAGGDSVTYKGGLDQQRKQKQELYAELKSGAESGWDFSTRWFIPSDKGPGSLKDLRTRAVVPVDLNALLFLNARLLSEFHALLGNSTAAEQYSALAEQQRANIEEVLWDEQHGSWFDWDTINQRRSVKFYPSNIFPVWVNASSRAQNARMVQYLQAERVLNFTSGVPTSMEESGQQWDFPNAWPPLQHVMVESLKNVGSEEAKQLALDQVQKWMDTNYLSYVEAKPHAMFEKYNVTRMGLPGGGGEYDVQLGFGWTNGVAMAFADEYGDLLHAPTASAARLSWNTVLVAALSWLLTVIGRQ